MSVKDSLQSVFDTIQAAKADDEWSLREVLQLVEAIASTVEEAVGGVAGDDEEWDTFVSDVEYFVEVYIVPLDLPVGPIIEGFIDSQLVGLVRPSLENLRPA